MESHIARTNMLKQQLRTGEVLNPTILGLYQTILREDFVDVPYKSFAYADLQIELPHLQRMMTPLEEARCLQALKLLGHEVVLEVGSGSGFFTALLSQLCKRVISIDYFEDFLPTASARLASYQCNNVELLCGDGARGWVDKAPYDVIVFTGALDKITDDHRLQVFPGGKLFAIVGQEPIMQGQLHHLSHQGEWRTEVIFETSIPPLIDRYKPNGFVF